MPPRIGFRQSERSHEPKVWIDQADLSGWPEGVKTDVLSSIAAVWLTWVDKTVQLLAGFLDEAPGTALEALLVSSGYDNEDGTFQFGRKAIERGRSEAEFRLHAISAGAHEAMHAVQCAQGREPTPGRDLVNDVDQLEAQLRSYEAEPSETEARREAERFVQAVLDVEGGREPTDNSATAQRYRELWAAHHRGQRLFRGRVIRPPPVLARAHAAAESQVVRQLDEVPLVLRFLRAIVSRLLGRS
ncbi:MAG: hypothetical protein ABR998_04595 [Gemmatimonadales bacterium]|jgi:hypothetical protein